MVLTKAAKQRVKDSAQEYNMAVDMGRILKYARRASGFSQLGISKCMEITEHEWQCYERNRRQIPTHIMLKLIMFGMDFWCKNRERVVPATAKKDTDTLSPAVIPILPDGELTTKH